MICNQKDDLKNVEYVGVIFSHVLFIESFSGRKVLYRRVEWNSYQWNKVLSLNFFYIIIESKKITEKFTIKNETQFFLMSYVSIGEAVLKSVLNYRPETRKWVRGQLRAPMNHKLKEYFSFTASTEVGILRNLNSVVLPAFMALIKSPAYFNCNFAYLPSNHFGWMNFWYFFFFCGCLR